MRKLNLLTGIIVAFGLVSIAMPAVAGDKGHHRKKTFTYIAPDGPGPDGATYFGTCLNLAGFQQAGNAGADGFCLPYGSIVSSVSGSGYCTTTRKMRSEGGKVTVSSTSPGPCPERKRRRGGQEVSAR